VRELNIKHPIVQFFAVGAILFVLNYLFTSGSGSDDQIVINDDNLKEGVKTYQSTWGEYPDSVMLRTILEDEIEREVLFRKGLELHLDNNNDAIKEELAMAAKQYLMAEADLTDPGDEVLRNYYADHESEFSIPDLFDFDQRYFGDSEKMAREAKNRLDKGIQVKGIEGIGMKLRYTDTSLAEIARIFGPEFSEVLASLQPGESSVMQSIWGWHLILLNEINEGSLVDFETNRNIILTSWRQQAQKNYYETVLEDLKSKVSIELSEDSTRYLNSR